MVKKKELVQPLILASILSIGFAVVWGLLGMWAVQVGEYLERTGTDVDQLTFAADGKARIAHRRIGQQDTWQTSDLEGNPIAPVDNTENHESMGTSLPAKLPESAGWGDVSWERRIQTFGDSRSPMTLWYLVSDGRPDGTAYFVGYNRDSKARIGYLGVSGFSETMPSTENRIPFGGLVKGPNSRVLGFELASRGGHMRGYGRSSDGFISPWDVYILGRGGNLYHADLQSRTMVVVLHDDRIRSAATLPEVSDAKRGALLRLAVRTEDTLLVLDARGQILRRYPISQSSRMKELHVMETSTGEAVMYWKRDREVPSHNDHYQIEWVTPNGVRREVQVVLRSNALETTPIQSGVVFPSPLLMVGGIACFLAPNDMEARSATYPQALARSAMMLWPGLAFAQLLAGALALLCYRRQVRYGASRTERIVWPLFVLLFGLPGWIGYRFGRSWPMLESCPECGVAVPRDRVGCARCESKFPMPALKGTEVFA